LKLKKIETNGQCRKEQKHFLVEKGRKEKRMTSKQ